MLESEEKVLSTVLVAATPSLLVSGSENPAACL